MSGTTTSKHTPSLLLALGCLLALGAVGIPATARAHGTGGTAAGSAQETLSGTAAAPGGQTESTPVVSGVPLTEPALITSGGAISLRASATGLLGHALVFAGEAPARDARDVIALERYAIGGWQVIARARASSAGTFDIHWRSDLAGRLSVRAAALRRSASATSSTHTADSSEPAQITIYKPAEATYYGPGFYGKRTACGQRMTPYLIGVANRTLPCGTLVEVSFEGHGLIVPVVDRGPYRAGASWDLTYRAALLLGALSTEDLGSLVVGKVPNTPALGVLPGLSASPVTGGSSAPSTEAGATS